MPYATKAMGHLGLFGLREQKVRDRCGDSFLRFGAMKLKVPILMTPRTRVEPMLPRRSFKTFILTST